MKLSILLLSLLLITSITAYTVYSGEPTYIKLNESYKYYTIAGNETEVILDVTQDENYNVTIIPNKYMASDNFEIIFFNTAKETITVYQSSGGGGGGTRTIYKDNVTYVPVDNYIAEYVDKEIEVEKEVEVEVPVEANVPWWKSTIMIVVLICIIISLLLYLLYYLSLKEDYDVKTITAVEGEPITETKVNEIETKINDKENDNTDVRRFKKFEYE